MLTSLTNLKKFFMFDGTASGTLPQNFGALSHLIDVMISNMPVSGDLPPTFGNLRRTMSVLDLSNCSLHGDLSNLKFQDMKYVHLQVRSID